MILQSFATYWNKDQQSLEKYGPHYSIRNYQAFEEKEKEIDFQSRKKINRHSHTDDLDFKFNRIELENNNHEYAK